MGGFSFPRNTYRFHIEFGCMARRPTNNRTNIPRIAGIPVHHAFIRYVCVRCHADNTVSVGTKLLTPQEAYESQVWKCVNCKFVHSKTSPLPTKDHKGKKTPFAKWEPVLISAESLGAQRFWKAFFTTVTEAKDAYAKQCNTCGRILPARAFSGHAGWGPLEKQMECRMCKAVINTTLNPKRTKEQLHESSIRRRTADLLLVGESERLDHKALFKRFGGKCFKTGKPLKYEERGAWAVDHILPSRWLYPLNSGNAALLSRAANENKRDRWPSEFYTNDELKRLAEIMGADLYLISHKTPIVNPNIDIDACVTRMLTVRSATDISRRVDDLKKLLEDNNLVSQLSEKNRRMLGYR